MVKSESVFYNLFISVALIFNNFILLFLFVLDLDLVKTTELGESDYWVGV